VTAQETAARPARLPLWRVISLSVGLALLFLLVRHVGLVELGHLMRRVGWTFLLLVVLYGGVHLLRTLSWRLCLGPDGRDLVLTHALQLWIAGEAVAHLSFAWSGEAFRAAATREKIPLQRGLTALVVSRAFYSYASLLITAASAAVCLFLPLPAELRAPLAATALVLVGASFLPLLVRSRVSRFLAQEAETENGRETGAYGRVRRFARSVRRDLRTILAQERGQFMWLVGLNLLAALAGVVEVYLILWTLGGNLNLATALVIEGAGKVLALGAFFVPGSLGVREGGTVLVLRLFEMSSALGVTLVLVRRARALVWVGVGSLLLLLHGLRSRLQREVRPASESEQEIAENLTSPPKV